MFRTDANNNPTAFTTDVAEEAGLTLGKDYTQGNPFTVNFSLSETPDKPETTYYTAKLLGDPVALTIRVIDTIGFKTSTEQMRWTYIAIPYFIWMELSAPQKRDVIGYMYQFEGGEMMRHFFPNYGKL